MALTLTGTQTAPDTWEFTITGVDPTTAEFTIDYGDGTALVTVPVDPSGTTVVAHTYMHAGHHVYTVTVRAARVAWATTLQQLHDQVPGTLADLNNVPSLANLGDISRDLDVAQLVVTVDVGPATIFATVVDGDPIPVVRVTAWVASPETVLQWSISRDAPGGSTVLWTSRQGQQATVLIDDLCPLGVPVTYRLIVTHTDWTTDVVLSNVVIIAGTAGCYLTDPVTGETMRITLMTWPSRQRAERQSVLAVLGRADPVVISDVHSWPSGTWTIYTPTDAALAQLLRILTDTNVVVLRTQPTSSIASVTAAVGRVTENRYTGTGGDQRRTTDVDIQEIAPLPATALPASASLQILHDLVPTNLGDLSLLRMTLLQLSQVQETTGVGVS